MMKGNYNFHMFYLNSLVSGSYILKVQDEEMMRTSKIQVVK
jgi:hypothetical protein